MLKRLRERIDFKVIALASVISSFINTSVAYATPVPDPTFDFLKKGSGSGAFDNLTKSAEETGASFYNFLLVIGVIGLVISTVALGISISFSKNSKTKQENKSHLPAIAGGAVLIFGSTTILGLIKTIADGI